jgi:hypothetical protein
MEDAEAPKKEMFYLRLRRTPRPFFICRGYVRLLASNAYEILAALRITV